MDNIKVDDIAEALRKRITTGEFGTGGRLPSLTMLAEQHHTSRETINKIIQRFQAEGLVTSLGLRGVFVSAQRVRIPGQMFNFSSYLKQSDLDAVETTIGAPKIIEASDTVAQFLGISEYDSVVHTLRLQGTTMANYRIIETYYPVRLIDASLINNIQENGSFDTLSVIEKGYAKIEK